MNNKKIFLLALVFVIIIVAAIIYFCVFVDNNVSHFVDNYFYDVQKKYDDNKDAAKLLHESNLMITNFIRKLKKKYITEPDKDNLTNPSFQICQRRIINLLNNYNPDALQETNPTNIEGDTSYVKFKGKIFSLCLRNKNDYSLHDFNILKFVIIHEISHLTVEHYGHDGEFWKSFKFLLQEAKKMGVYEPHDFSKKPYKYCGLTINYSPYYDASL